MEFPPLTTMLIVKVRISPSSMVKEAIKIARGDVVSVKSDQETGGCVGQLVLRDDDQLEKLRAAGFSVEVIFDSRTAPDPRREVGEGDRYAEELKRLKREKGKA